MSPWRILISSTTNVAVDRILQVRSSNWACLSVCACVCLSLCSQLKRHKYAPSLTQSLVSLNFEDFVRVGSAKKIAKPLLPYSTHGIAGKDQEVGGLSLIRDFPITLLTSMTRDLTKLSFYL